MATEKPDVILYLSDSRGVYIPRDFAQETFPECIEGVSDEDIATLKAGPDHEWYWEAWDTVCNNAIVVERVTDAMRLKSVEPTKYRIYQDGDCWLIPVGMEFDESREDSVLGGYYWPDESAE